MRVFIGLDHPATVLGAAVILSLGCGDSSGPMTVTPPVPTGAVELTVSTSGANIDPDGYFVLVDDQPMIPAFGPNAVVTIPALSKGSHGGSRVRLTTNAASDSRPAWSPDGARIAFVSDRDGNSEIYLMNADGTGQFRLTYNNSYDIDPAWSPEGKSIAFVTDPHGASGGILVITVDGTETRRLTSNVHGDFAPAWSPDGTRIAFSAGLGSAVSAIFVMNADGSARTEYSGKYSYAADPTWSPDSRDIAFAAETCAGYYDCSTQILVIRPDRTSIALTGEGVRQDPAWRP